MRGTTSRQMTMLGWIEPEALIPANHPIGRVKPLAEVALPELEPTFAAMYAQIGRPSIPPEQLLKSCLLMALYTIRSERQFFERLRYDLLFKWFLDINLEDEPFDHSSFAKNRKRLLEHRVSRQFFEAVGQQARKGHLLSSQHFTVDGTLLESWASMKSLRPRDHTDDPGDGNGYPPGNPDVDLKGQRRSNETYFSPTEKEALMARKGRGKETRLCFSGHVLMENRHGLAVDVEFTQATGTSEREAALVMLRRVRRHPCTLGADKGYDLRDFITSCQALRVTPHPLSDRRLPALEVIFVPEPLPDAPSGVSLLPRCTLVVPQPLRDHRCHRIHHRRRRRLASVILPWARVCQCPPHCLPAHPERFGHRPNAHSISRVSPSDTLDISHLDHACLPVRVGCYTAHGIGLRVGQGGPPLLHHSRLRVGPLLSGDCTS